VESKTKRHLAAASQTGGLTALRGLAVWAASARWCQSQWSTFLSFPLPFYFEIVRFHVQFGRSIFNTIGLLNESYLGRFPPKKKLNNFSLSFFFDYLVALASHLMSSDIPCTLCCDWPQLDTLRHTQRGETTHFVWEMDQPKPLLFWIKNLSYTKGLDNYAGPICPLNIGEASVNFKSKSLQLLDCKIPLHPKWEPVEAMLRFDSGNSLMGDKIILDHISCRE